MLVLMAAALLAGFAGSAPAPAVVPQDRGHLNVVRGPDPRRWAYDSVWVECDRIIQMLGRNGAWGRKDLPLDSISAGAVLTGDDLDSEEMRGAAAAVVFRCTDGSNCIGVGQLQQTTPQLSEHAIAFDTPEHARAFVDDLARFRTDCAARQSR